jgi:trk system potassium uptake protein TrkA
MLFGVPRTMALVNDPDHEEVFRQLGVTEVLSATRVIGSLIEGRTVLDEVTNLFPAAEGRFHVTELVLPTGAPAISQSLQALGLPRGALVAAIVRGEQVLVPRGESRLEATDRLILITTPDSHAGALKVLIGEEGA